MLNCDKIFKYLTTPNRRVILGNMKKLSVMKLNKNAKLPERQTSGSAGYDIAACLEKEITLRAGETQKIGTGIAIALDEGYAAFIYARSGLGINKGIIPANCVGVIDSDYRGEIIVGVKNTSSEPFKISNGDRIAQMVITKCETPELFLCETLEKTKRNSGGFGSTGKS